MTCGLCGGVARHRGENLETRPKGWSPKSWSDEQDRAADQIGAAAPTARAGNGKPADFDRISGTHPADLLSRGVPVFLPSLGSPFDARDDLLSPRKNAGPANLSVQLECGAIAELLERFRLLIGVALIPVWGVAFFSLLHQWQQYGRMEFIGIPGFLGSSVIHRSMQCHLTGRLDII